MILPLSKISQVRHTHSSNCPSALQGAVISFCGRETTNCLGHVALVTELVKRWCERKIKLKSSYSSNSYNNVELF
ncbi:unnamed protein product [Camellia sinensis]